LIDPTHPGYLGFRILGALTTLGSAAACGVLAFWVSGSWLGAVLAPLIYLSFAVVSPFDVTARSDSRALLMSFAAFLVVYRFRNFRLGVVLLQATMRGWIRGVVLLLAARETLPLGRRVCGSSRAGMAGTDGAVRVRDLPRPELRATLSDLYCDDFLARALLGES